MVSPVKATWKKKMETERMSENVRVKVSSIRPGVYPTVMRSQQREEAHVSVCLVAGATGSLSLYMAVKLSHLTRGGKSHSLTFLKMDRWRHFSVLICPKSLQTWLAGVYVLYILSVLILTASRRLTDSQVVGVGGERF